MIDRGGDVDTGDAAAERRLDRAADEADDAVEEAAVEGAAGTVRPDEFGIHVDEEASSDDVADDEDATTTVTTPIADALDAVAEAFNARDLDAVVDALADDAEVPGVLGNDRANLPTSLEGLWRRRPTALLLRGSLDDDAVGVLWEHDGDQWWPIAAVHVDDVVDGRIGVLEVSEDPGLLEQVRCEPPEVDDLEEGARWREWEEGAEG